MELEARTSQGELIAEYKGQMALINFDKLMNAKDLFTMVTKKLTPTKGGESKEFVCFVAKVTVNLNITEEFILWIHEHDYIKVIR
jgi:hypothetical protein